MKKKHIILFNVIIIICSIVFVLYPVRYDIETPRLGQPAIKTAGEEIEITLKSSMPIWGHQWSASINKNNIETPLKITSLTSHFSTHKIRVKTDSTLSPGKYSLVIRDKNHKKIATDAVHILKSYPNEISIIQLADLPIFSASGKQEGDLKFLKIIEEINLINPTLVLFTGDLVYGGKWDQYQQFFLYLQKINAPIIAAPGNHEYQGWSAFLTYYGQPYHSNNFGPYKIISINSGHARDQLTESQLQWLENAFEENKNAISVLQSHHSIMHRKKQRGYLQANVDTFKKLVNDNKVSIVLSGHWHADSVWNSKNEEQFIAAEFPGTPYAVTTSAGAVLRQKHSSAEPLYHGYRLIRIKDGSLLNYTYDYDGDGVRDPSSSIPMGKLSQTNTSDTEVTVKNELNESFDHARVDIRVSKKRLNLAPNTGTLMNIYVDDTSSIYSIKVHLPANSTTNIHLQEKSDPK